MPMEMSFHEDGRLMRLNIASPLSSSEMRDINQQGQNYFADVPFTVHILLDVRAVKSLTPDSMRLDTYRDLNHPKMGKCAIVGANQTLRAITNALTSVLNYTNLSFFATDEEALAWIRTAIEADKQRELKAS